MFFIFVRFNYITSISPQNSMIGWLGILVLKCKNLGFSPNVNGSPILATILANPSLKNCWLYIKGVVEDVLDPISFWLIWDCLGSNASCFLVHCSTCLLRWLVSPLVLQLYVFFYNIYIMLDFLPLVLYFVYLL